jgi:hypothetical protein
MGQRLNTGHSDPHDVLTARFYTDTFQAGLSPVQLFLCRRMKTSD